MSQLFGSADAVELPTKRVFDPRSGWQYIRRWRGPTAALDGIQLSLVSVGVRVERDPGDAEGIGIISGTFGAEESQSPDEPLADVWTLAGNDLEKTLWELPAVKHEFESLESSGEVSPADIAVVAKLRTDLDLLARGAVQTEGANGSPIPLSWDILASTITALGLEAGIFKELLWCMAQSIESFSVSQYVLRHARVIAANAGESLKPSYTNVGKVLKTATLKSQEQVPDTIKFQLPDGVWLKRTPTLDQTAADKFTITQEWWHADSYAKFIYGKAL